MYCKQPPKYTLDPSNGWPVVNGDRVQPIVCSRHLPKALDILEMSIVWNYN
jgi:hypothetical protein